MMGRGRGSGAVAAALLCFSAPAAIGAEEEATAPQVVQELEKSFGVHPGERRNHTKGVCATGEFVGTRDAARYSRSALFSGNRVPVVARFSNAGGNPKAPDTAKTPRGMALEFRLPGGAVQHITMIHTPIFGAATPEAFLENVIATRADPATGKPDPEKVKAFLAKHPEAQPQARFLAEHTVPASYANISYFGLHTFKFIGGDGKATPVRWQFVPQDGEKWLSEAEMKSAGNDFLEPALMERLKHGPVRWDMVVTVGHPNDPANDPTQPWPMERSQFTAGTLTITAATPQKGAECEGINYDPMTMADGIAPTDDPVLRFRSPAYAVSFAKRRSGS
jgi:catalase